AQFKGTFTSHFNLQRVSLFTYHPVLIIRHFSHYIVSPKHHIVTSTTAFLPLSLLLLNNSISAVISIHIRS
ncbi:hypothetical protein, partial [Paenibacillus jilunlii]|uniref:hypothetical protein n=1 Tax=Paenibacillus jilunlii TaxID=682956 RepID=UPI001AD8438E